MSAQRSVRLVLATLGLNAIAFAIFSAGHRSTAGLLLVGWIIAVGTCAIRQSALR